MHRCTISHIDPDSPLRHAAHPGDRLVSINGNPITDVLDYKYYAYDPELAVCLRRPDGTEHTVHVSKPLGGELGLDFETYLMDNAHSCANHCVFCFIDQMPPGIRARGAAHHPPAHQPHQCLRARDGSGAALVPARQSPRGQNA